MHNNRIKAIANVLQLVVLSFGLGFFIVTYVYHYFTRYQYDRHWGYQPYQHRYDQRAKDGNVDGVYDPALVSDVDANRVESETRVLLVTAWFPTNGRERRALELGNASSVTRLRRLTQNILDSITTDVYVYAPPALASVLDGHNHNHNRTRNGNGNGSNVIIVDPSFESPFDVPPLKDRRKAYRYMMSHDPDMRKFFRMVRPDVNHHEGEGEHEDEDEVYALRNSKPFFLERAIQSLQEKKKVNYDYVFWIDADGFPDGHPYALWPDPARLDKIWRDASSETSDAAKKAMGWEKLFYPRPKRDLMFFPLNDVPSMRLREWTVDQGPIDVSFAEGSFFGGPPSAIAWFARTFYAHHDHFLTRHRHFVGVDSHIYNALLFLFPSRFIGVWAADPAAPAIGSGSGMPPEHLGRGPLGACGTASASAKGGVGGGGGGGGGGGTTKYYQWWLSDRATRERLKDQWMRSSVEGEDEDEDNEVHTAAREEKTHLMWRFNVPCRMTRVVGVLQALSTALGKWWTPPAATVGSDTGFNVLW